MNLILQVLVERDNMSLAEAKEMLKDTRQCIQDGDDPEGVLKEWFGLEPDYIFDLI